METNTERLSRKTDEQSASVNPVRESYDEFQELAEYTGTVARLISRAGIPGAAILGLVLIASQAMQQGGVWGWGATALAMILLSAIAHSAIKRISNGKDRGKDPP